MHDDPAPDLWLNCPQCHNVMVPLNTYEIKASAEPGLDADPWHIMLFGWTSIIYKYIFGKAELEGDKVRLANAKRDVLPEFPKSQVCPKCFHISKRR